MVTVAHSAFLFPGQGSQYAGMFAALRNLESANKTFQEAERVLEMDIATADTAAALADTHGAQLALLIAGVAGARVLEHRDILPAYAVGHSVGAFAAAVHAGTLKFDDALRLVDLRGRLMAQAYPSGYGMAAISGMTESQVQRWIDDARNRGAEIYLTNRNAPRQFTVSGRAHDLDSLIETAKTHGANKAARLAVATPSHSPLMADVAQRMVVALSAVTLSDPRLPVLSNRNARMLNDARSIAEDLADGVAHPVQWHDAISVLHERGVRIFVEMPPGKVLSQLVETSFEETTTIAADAAGFATVEAMLTRFSTDP